VWPWAATGGVAHRLNEVIAIHPEYERTVLGFLATALGR
jgi:hypothetical protein